MVYGFGQIRGGNDKIYFREVFNYSEKNPNKAKFYNVTMLDGSSNEAYIFLVHEDLSALKKEVESTPTRRLVQPPARTVDSASDITESEEECGPKTQAKRLTEVEFATTALNNRVILAVQKQTMEKNVFVEPKKRPADVQNATVKAKKLKGEDTKVLQKSLNQSKNPEEKEKTPVKNMEISHFKDMSQTMVESPPSESPSTDNSDSLEKVVESKNNTNINKVAVLSLTDILANTEGNGDSRKGDSLVRNTEGLANLATKDYSAKGIRTSRDKENILKVSLQSKEEILEIKKLKLSLKKAHEVIDVEREKNIKLESQKASLKLMHEESYALNIELQREILDHFKHSKDVESSIEKIKNNITNQWPSVGFIRQSDKHIHLGRGIYMPLLCYDAAKVNAKSKFSIFVRNIAVFVFTPQVLISSSVEGIKCNRTKTSHPALDSTKLSAIHYISRFYLKELGTNEVTIGLLVDKIGRIINSKISDMRRLPGSRRSKSNKRSTDELSENSHPDVIFEETIDENLNGYNTTIRQRLDNDTDSEEAEEAVVIGQGGGEVQDVDELDEENGGEGDGDDQDSSNINEC